MQRNKKGWDYKNLKILRTKEAFSVEKKIFFNNCLKVLF